MTRKEERRIVLALVHAAEEVAGRKVSALERAHLRALLRGAGKPIAFEGGDCGRRTLELRAAHGEGFDYRWAVSAKAMENGCREEAKRLLAATEERVWPIIRELGRKGLPVKGFAVRVDQDGKAVGEPIGTVSFDRGS